MTIAVKNGVATLDVMGGGTFVGCTSSEGSFPPSGQDYTVFMFAPKKGAGGILVFQDRAIVRMTGAQDYTFHQYYWQGEKLIVDYGIKSPARAYSSSRDMGLIVQFRDWFYITSKPVADVNCKVVDLFEMLRYIEGKINLADLDRSARSYERRKQHEVRMKDLKAEVSRLSDENSTLEGAVTIGSALFDHASKQVDEASKAYLTHFNAVVEMRPLRDRLRRFPRWLLSRASRQFLDAIGKTNLTT